MDLKRHVNTTFKMHGYNLRSDASARLVELLHPVVDERDKWLEKIIEWIQKQGLDIPVVEKHHIDQAAQECSRAEAVGVERVFDIISAFEAPKLTYNAEQKKSFVAKEYSTKLFGTADDKTALYRNRFNLVYQRILRNNLFVTSTSEMNQQGEKAFLLKPVEYLLGCSAKVEDVVVFGMLAQIKEGKYHLEDLTGTVELNFSQTRFHKGLYVENSFVLAEGWYDDRVFHVNALGFPPPETATVSRSYLGNVNSFGGSSEVCLKTVPKLLEVEKKATDAMIVILSDVYLDNTKVMSKLRILFDGYSDSPPEAFVLCGNFVSSPHAISRAESYRKHFKELADLIATFPSLIENTRIVLVPGPQDLSYGLVYPRAPFSPTLTDYFSKKVPLAVFATNPCRIQYCTKEIVIFCEDIVGKLSRNAIYFPESGTIPEHFSRTIVSQSHLSPLPLHICPVYWTYDHSMYLYPLPDLLVCAGKFDPFTVSQADCLVTNPGSFLKTDFSFKVYLPATNTIEDSQIPEDTA